MVVVPKADAHLNINNVYISAYVPQHEFLKVSYYEEG